MSDYWKSTPKYWCDHCKVYVRDTKLEKTNHESTAKHQSGLSRFLRNIHKDNDREERERQRAKDEIARLNGNLQGQSSKPTAKLTAAGSSDAAPRQATAEERKRQIQQLAAMGVAVPEQFRKDMAMVGDWEVVQNKPQVEIGTRIKSEGQDLKPVPGPIGKKRPMAESGLDEGESERKRVAWGSAERSYKDSKKEDELNALLGLAEPIGSKIKVEGDESAMIKMEADAEEAIARSVKLEDDHEAPRTQPDDIPETKPILPDEEPEVVFKKRKSKSKPSR